MLPRWSTEFGKPIRSAGNRCCIRRPCRGGLQTAGAFRWLAPPANFRRTSGALLGCRTGSGRLHFLKVIAATERQRIV